MSGWAASLEKARTAPGLVVWSSSVTSSTCFPSTPPDLLTRSSATAAGQRVSAAVGGRAGCNGQHHADLDRFVRSAGDAGKCGRRQTGGQSQILRTVL